MLEKPCTILPGVGPSLETKLLKCGITTIASLLFHLPFRYQDRTRVTAISDLRPNDWCVIKGKVVKTEITYGKRMSLSCYVDDQTGLLKLRFFHFNKQQIQTLNKSDSIRAFGEVKELSSSLVMAHPEYQLMVADEECIVNEALTPIYPSTQGLTQTRLRQLVNAALALSQETLEQLEWMTPEQLKTHCFYSVSEAIGMLHNPPPDTSLQAMETGQHPAIKRLLIDELVGHQLAMQFARKNRHQLSAPSLSLDASLVQRFLDQLPFKLTQAQWRVSQEIAQDLTQSKPMLRLVQGDVGSGKTLVAALAALQALAQGYQVALMVPTELLSEQHTLSLQSWMSPLGFNCFKLHGKMKQRERNNILEGIANNQCHLVIGTHALFQENVAFANLGLIIIDEQHRFGVEQRLLLQQKGQQEKQVPHQLLMTATPIPRTLAMTQLAHFDLSIIDELPAGRAPIITAVLNQEKREPIIIRLRAAIKQGRQAYWVCTLIEESESSQSKAAIATTLYLQQQLPEIRIGLVHGRMKTLEKEQTMRAFKENSIDLLVATTVIEVGVDVPNASLMIIENAERLGLSQLHQLRGRIGRGQIQSHCLLLYQSPLSSLGAERLRLLRETNDGFIIAERDLQLRGSGEVLGTRQTGYHQYKIANLMRDHAQLPTAIMLAKQLIDSSPSLARRIAERWLGDFEQFLQG